MTTFDVVVIGDSSLHYVHSLLEDLLQVPSSNKKRDGRSSGDDNSGVFGGSLRQGLRNRLGMLLSGTGSTTTTSTTSAPQGMPVPHYGGPSAQQVPPPPSSGYPYAAVPQQASQQGGYRRPPPPSSGYPPAPSSQGSAAYSDYPDYQ